jgi:hypothetical protein
MPFILSRPTATDAPRLAEIQQVAFVDDAFTLGPLRAVPKEAYIRWVERAFLRPRAPPGHRAEYVCARDAATGKVGGWALWSVPLADGKEGAPLGEVHMLPEGIDAPIWTEFWERNSGHIQGLLGDHKRWSACTHALHRCSSAH